MTEPTDVEAVVAPAGPTTAAQVARWLSMTGEPSLDVQTTTAAVNRLVRRWRPVPADGEAWPEDDVLGATMLATRLYRRRNSPAGVETFGADGAAYVSRNDPDVAMLLQLGAYAPPWVG